MKWKTKIVSTVLALSIMVPTAAFAADATANTNFPKGPGHHKQLSYEEHQARQDQLMELVNTYAPNTVDEWEDLLDQKQELLEEIRELKDSKPGKVNDEVREQLESIRESLRNGDMTQEEAKQAKEELGIERKQGNGNNREEKENREQQRTERHDQLKEAIEADDADQIQELLQQRFERTQESIEHLTEKLSEIRS